MAEAEVSAPMPSRRKPILLDEEDQHQLQLLNQPVTEDINPDEVQRPSEELAHSPAGIYALWKFMVFTRDDQTFDETWSRIKRDFAEQEAIIGYLEKQYLPVKEQWAGAWISRVRNFGQRTTSTTESAHRELKSYLVSGKSHLYRLHEVISEMLGAKETTFKERTM
ncbi:hypothetical protein C8A03DRAFT_38227, partial [Achaetomium macrosporum]